MPKAYRGLFACIFFAVLTSCSDLRDTNSRDVSEHLVTISMDSLFALGNPDLMTEPFLPGHAALSTTGDTIFVADLGEHVVKWYDSNGDFIGSFGREGSGPGEFITFSTLMSDPDRGLVIGDPRNGRVTVLQYEKDPVQFYSTDFATLTLLEAIQTKGDQFVVSAFGSLDGEEPGMLFTTDSTFVETRNYFSTIDEMYPSKDGLNPMFLRLMPSKMMAHGDGFLLAPAAYGGELLAFMPDLEGTYRIVQRLKGNTYRRALTEVEGEISRETSDLQLFGPGGLKIGALIHNQSRGLIKTSTGHIVHFSQVQKENVKQLQAEVFSDQGDLVGYANLYSVEVSPTGTGWVDWSLLTFDPNRDIVYVMRSTPNPNVTAFKLRIEEIEN